MANKDEARRELYDFLRDFDGDDYGIERSYTELYNAVADYIDDTDDYQFEYLFEDYVDDYLIAERVKAWADEYDWGMICKYLEDADDSGINRIDAYGWLHYVDASDLNDIRDEILSEISKYFEGEEEESEEDYE